MKSFYLNLLVLVMALIPFYNFAQQQQISLVSNVWPPFTNVEGRQSISNQIVQTALSRINVESTTHIQSFQDVLIGVKEEKYSGSAALWKNPEREEYLLFSEPYLQNQLMLVGLKGTEVNISSLAQLENKTVGLVKSYAYADSLMNHPNIKFEYSASDEQNVEKLVQGKIDYLLVDNIVIHYITNHDLSNVADTLAISTHPFSTKNLYFALHKNVPNAADIMSQFNEQIKQMVLDGTIHTILGMQWIKADVNNDGVPELVLNGNQAGVQAPASAYQLFHDSNAASQQNGYYINGAYYNSWAEVPKDYKTTPKNQPNPESLSPGVRIKF